MRERPRRQDGNDVGPKVRTLQVELGGEPGDPEGGPERGPGGELGLHQESDGDGVLDDLIEPNRAVVGLVGGGLVRSRECGEAELQGHVVRRVDRDQRPQEVVPRPQELDHGQSGQGREREREHDAHEDRQP